MAFPGKTKKGHTNQKEEVMIKGISLSETQEVELDQDKDEPRTKWVLGVIPSGVVADIKDRITIFESDREVAPDARSTMARTKLQMNASDVEYVRFGLKGFSNFLGSDGKPVSFASEPRFVAGKNMIVVQESILDIIPFPVIGELADKIRKLNRMNLTETKN